ncbi:MAG: hypothetical protein EOP02_03815 [Proteobacteria bacterium]|nr:MAG: hypothetical protein EOP02_03815 [Pseudomonadota bacterium]
MVDSVIEVIAKERLVASRRALLREMGVQTPVSNAHVSPVIDAQTVTVEPPHSRLKRPPLWRVLTTKAIERWWTRHPLVVALQIAQPVLRPYARQHPAVLIAGGATVGAALYVLRPWRLLSVTSLAILVLRGPALPRKALKWVQVAQQKGSANPAGRGLS